MTKEQFVHLERGDIVRNRITGNSYVISGTCNDILIAVRTIDVINPDEWSLVSKDYDQKDN